MRRSTEISVTVALVVVVALAAALSQRAADPTLREVRRSTRLTTRLGAKALRQTLEGLGVPVTERRESFFRGAGDPTLSDTGVLVMLLDPLVPPTGVERQRLQQFVERGGHLFLAASTGVERCFGWSARRLGTGGDQEPDSLDVRGPPYAVRLPATRMILAPPRPPDRRALPPPTESDCMPHHAPVADTLLATITGRPVAVRLAYPSGGTVLLLADSRFVTNRELKNTDAGVLVISWIVARHPARVVVDEYHQGFGESDSILMAAWRWVVGDPAGWMLLAWIAAGLVALTVVAMRFGPARHVVERRRRSPLEHLEAVAVGLERAGAADTAVRLLLAGLWRRLSRAAGRGARPASRLSGAGRWLHSLELAARTPEAREQVHRLAMLMDRSGEERVLQAAQAVEDVWTSLGQANGSRRYSPR